MKDRKQYYSLDEIGFVGTQKSDNEIASKQDISDTIQFIKSRKANGVSLNLKKGVIKTPVSKLVK